MAWRKATSEDYENITAKQQEISKQKIRQTDGESPRDETKVNNEQESEEKAILTYVYEGNPDWKYKEEITFGIKPGQEDIIVYSKENNEYLLVRMFSFENSFTKT